MQYFKVLPIVAWYLGNVESLGERSVSSPKVCRDECISLEVVHRDIIVMKLSKSPLRLPYTKFDLTQIGEL